MLRIRTALGPLFCQSHHPLKLFKSLLPAFESTVTSVPWCTCIFPSALGQCLVRNTPTVEHRWGPLWALMGGNRSVAPQTSSHERCAVAGRTLVVSFRVCNMGWEEWKHSAQGVPPRLGLELSPLAILGTGVVRA